MSIAYIRSVLLYLLLLVTIRLMGKRQLGEMEPTEFVVTMLLANLASIPMQDASIPLYTGIVPILTVLALELVLSWLNLHSIPVRKLLCGKPVILIDNGTVCQGSLRKARITLDELTCHLRQQGVLELDTVKYAILETNGQISTFLFAADRPPTCRESGIRGAEELLPYTLISDGRILHGNLQTSGRDRHWLDRTLRAHGCTASEVFLLTVDSAGKIYLIKKEKQP